MKSQLLFVIAAISLQLIVGCGSMNTVSYYEPVIKNSQIPTEKASGGIAFSEGEICIHVSEGGSKNIYPRAMTLVGVPVLPVGIEGKKYEMDYFDLVLWLVPEQGNTDFSIDVQQITLELDNGVKLIPNVVQVSRFKTIFEKETVYAFQPDVVEKISYPEHWGGKPLSDLKEPIKLWDWSRLTLRFEKTEASLGPKQLHISGLLKNNKKQEVSKIGFSFVSETRQAFPGRWADGTSYTDYPERACRRLQQNQQNTP